ASCHWSCLRPFLRAPTVAPTQLSGRRHAPAPVAGSPPAANVPSVFARPRSRAADHAPVPWAWVRRPRARHAALDSRPGNNAAPIRPRPWPHRSASALRPAPREWPLPDACVGLRGKESISGRLTEGNDRLLRVNLDCSRYDLKIEFDPMRCQGLVDAYSIRCTPLLLKPGPTKRNRDRRLIQFVLQPVGERPVELFFGDFGRRHDRWRH